MKSNRQSDLGWQCHGRGCCTLAVCSLPLASGCEKTSISNNETRTIPNELHTRRVARTHLEYTGLLCRRNFVKYTASVNTWFAEIKWLRSPGAKEQITKSNAHCNHCVHPYLTDIQLCATVLLYYFSHTFCLVQAIFPQHKYCWLLGW